jgi:hypothetical protein
MDEVMIVPPTSIFTCAVVEPLVTLAILPFKTLCALIFMSPQRQCHRRVAKPLFQAQGFTVLGAGRF